LDGSEKVSKRTVRFEDEEQLLKTFIIVWSVGFVWCFALKWPYTIRSLFLRRCLLQESTHVAVLVKRMGKEQKGPNGAANKSGCFGHGFLTDLFARVYGYVRAFMSLLFSDNDCFHLSADGVYQICPVQKGSDGTRFFVFLFRRYNFDAETAEFVPGKMVVGESVKDLQAAGSSDNGLSVQDVEDRYRIVGLNSIEMEKPVFLKVVSEEFSKPFYTYQLFMIWSCKWHARHDTNRFVFAVPV